MEKTFKIYNSFKEQEEDEIRYWQNLSGEEKLYILEVIRSHYWALKNENPGRLQRVYKIIERK